MSVRQLMSLWSWRGWRRGFRWRRWRGRGLASLHMIVRKLHGEIIATRRVLQALVPLWVSVNTITLCPRRSFLARSWLSWQLGIANSRRWRWRGRRGRGRRRRGFWRSWLGRWCFCGWSAFRAIVIATTFIVSALTVALAISPTLVVATIAFAVLRAPLPSSDFSTALPDFFLDLSQLCQELDLTDLKLRQLFGLLATVSLAYLEQRRLHACSFIFGTNFTRSASLRNGGTSRRPEEQRCKFHVRCRMIVL